MWPAGSPDLVNRSRTRVNASEHGGASPRHDSPTPALQLRRNTSPQRAGYSSPQRLTLLSRSHAGGATEADAIASHEPSQTYLAELTHAARAYVVQQQLTIAGPVVHAAAGSRAGQAEARTRAAWASAARALPAELKPRAASARPSIALAPMPRSAAPPLRALTQTQPWVSAGDRRALGGALGGTLPRSASAGGIGVVAARTLRSDAPQSASVGSAGSRARLLASLTQPLNQPGLSFGVRTDISYAIYASYTGAPRAKARRLSPNARARDGESGVGFDNPSTWLGREPPPLPPLPMGLLSNSFGTLPRVESSSNLDADSADSGDF
jgi:hypothetical protein